MDYISTKLWLIMQLFVFCAHHMQPGIKYGIKMKRFSAGFSLRKFRFSSLTFNAISVVLCYRHRHIIEIWFSSATIIIMRLDALQHPPVKREWQAWTPLHNTPKRGVAIPRNFKLTQRREIMRTPVQVLIGK